MEPFTTLSMLLFTRPNVNPGEVETKASQTPPPVDLTAASLSLIVVSPKGTPRGRGSCGFRSAAPGRLASSITRNSTSFVQCLNRYGGGIATYQAYQRVGYACDMYTLIFNQTLQNCQFGAYRLRSKGLTGLKGALLVVARVPCKMSNTIGHVGAGFGLTRCYIKNGLSLGWKRVFRWREHKLVALIAIQKGGVKYFRSRAR